MLLLHHVNFLEAQPRTGFCSNNTLILYGINVFHIISYSILRSKGHRQNKIVDAFSIPCVKCHTLLYAYIMLLHSVLPAMLWPADPDRMWA